jgi:hypothetical protein
LEIGDTAGLETCATATGWAAKKFAPMNKTFMDSSTKLHESSPSFASFGVFRAFRG